MRIRFTFNDRSLTATLYDNPTARDFASMLPSDLEIEDYGKNEKIVYLPRKLTEDGSGPFGNERPGDLRYFKPWGNLALFYDDYRWDGLIRLGRFDGGFEPLSATSSASEWSASSRSMPTNSRSPLPIPRKAGA